jgi:transposase-like protein
MTMHLNRGNHMRIDCILPALEPAHAEPALVCPTPGCTSTTFRLHQRVAKPLNDPEHSTLEVVRYRCAACGCTFRVYPRGVTRAATSERVRMVATLLYFLGLSYGSVSALLGACKIYLCKSRVHDIVAAARRRYPVLQRATLFTTIRTNGPHEHGLDVRYQDYWLPVELGRCTTEHALGLHVSALPQDERLLLQQQLWPVVTHFGMTLRVVAPSEHAVHDTPSPNFERAAREKS